MDHPQRCLTDPNVVVSDAQLAESSIGSCHPKCHLSHSLLESIALTASVVFAAAVLQSRDLRIMLAVDYLLAQKLGLTMCRFEELCRSCQILLVSRPTL